jgi:hypothetical protein
VIADDAGLPPSREKPNTEKYLCARGRLIRCYHLLSQLFMIGAIVGVTEERVIVTPCLHRTGALSGWDVAKQFRAVRLGMPIIYTSGNLVDRSRGVAGSLFFDKPYRPVAIIEACEKLA